MPRVLKFGALTAIVLVAGTWTATHGQTGNRPGSLDTSFGTGGVAITDLSLRRRRLRRGRLGRW